MSERTIDGDTPAGNAVGIDGNPPGPYNRGTRHIHAVLGDLRGIRTDHEHLTDWFGDDPVGFVEADAETLARVPTIGEVFARKIVIRKHQIYGDDAAEPDPSWPEFHSHAIVEARYR